MFEKIGFVQDLKNWYKLWSVQLMGLLAVFSFIEGALPYWQTVIPTSVYPWVVGIISTLAALARFIKQNDLIKDENDEQKSN